MWTAAIGVIGALASRLIGQGATKATGAISGLTAVAAVAGSVMWLFGPGREWHISLNALELSGVALGASVLLEWARRAPPPGG